MADTKDNVFMPVVCSYVGSDSSKIYIVKDLEAGMAILKSPDVKYSITNGDVKDCYPLTLEMPKSTTRSWAEYDADAETEYLANDVDIAFDNADFDANGAWTGHTVTDWDPSEAFSPEPPADMNPFN